MSFLFGRQPQISSEQKIAQAEAEIDMVSDMYSRYEYTPRRPPYSFYPILRLVFLFNLANESLTMSSLVASCSKKCIDSAYREPDLNKGESVCLDRCVAKFFEVNVKVSEKMQGEAQGRQGGAGGGMFGGGM
jgi:import inner membrane translocase subunit TIM10